MSVVRSATALIGAAGLAALLATAAQAEDLAAQEAARVALPGAGKVVTLGNGETIVIPNVDFGRYDRETCLSDASALRSQAEAETDTTRIKILAYEAIEACEAGDFAAAEDNMNSARDRLAQVTGGETIK